MARFLLPCRRIIHLKSLAPSSSSSTPASFFLSLRSYISEMRRAAFKETLLRNLRAEITYEAESRPPSTPESTFRSFSIHDRPGEKWIQLRRSHGREEVTIDATMFDGVAPSSRSAAAAEVADPSDLRRHISLMVEVSKGEASGIVLRFACSAWADDLQIDNIFPARRGNEALMQYMGPEFKELDDELQSAAREYLEKRGVNDELSGFLHDYMENKDRSELLRWLRNVETYVKK
ncbi:hypothetical protein Cni_G04994 [Canna indica]|uniref:Mitochondrial glycoprotein n=1 Tax=Canna indica TaxID=4628 RepID=A0AAQ3JWE7_9LILI|nr:hypothetical protein Cni_G04994 [Canna indica]